MAQDMTQADRLSKIEKDLDELKQDMKKLRAWTNQMDGGRKALLWIAGAVVSIVSVVFYVTRFLEFWK